MIIGYTITPTTLVVCISCQASMVDDSLTLAFLRTPYQLLIEKHEQQ